MSLRPGLGRCCSSVKPWLTSGSNRALEALGEDRAGRALEWLSASCVARPTDAVACRALAKTLGHNSVVGKKPLKR